MRIEEMASEALEKRHWDLLEEIAQIKSQLATAKGHAASTGDYADAGWFQRANHALRMKQIDLQQVMAERGQRKREATQARDESFGQRFIAVAKRRLDRDLFLSLVDEANDDGL